VGWQLPFLAGQGVQLRARPLPGGLPAPLLRPPHRCAGCCFRRCCCHQVSADGEVKLYEACVAAGITLLSIAHRCASGQALVGAPACMRQAPFIN
jgi:hypothetical protein